MVTIERLGGVAATLAVLAIAGPAHAQTRRDPPVAVTPNSPGSDLPVAAAQTTDAPQPSDALSDIVVTAQRRSQSLSKVPIPVQAVDSEQLAAQVVTDTRGLIQVAPSVGYQGGFSINAGGFLIRGVTSNSSEGGVQQSTAMLIDGVPLSRPGEFINDLGDIERVEILRGPQGTLIGKNATAGAISIVTRRPGDAFEAELQAGATTDEEYSVRGMLNLPLADGVRSRVNLVYSDLDPLVRNLGIAGDIYGRRVFGARGRIEADLAADVRLTLTGEYSEQRNSFTQAVVFEPNTGFAALHVATLGYQPRLGLVQVNTNGRAREEAEGYAASAELAWDLSDEVTLTSLSAYRDFRSDNNADTDITPVGLAGGVGLAPNPLNYPIQHITADLPRNPTRVRYFTQELRLNYTGDVFDVVGGLFLQTLRDDGRNQVPNLLRNPALPPGSFVYTNAQSRYRIDDDTWAAFGDVAWRVFEQVSVFGGLRYTREKVAARYDVRNFGPIGTRLAVATPGVNLDPITGAYSGEPLEVRAFELDRNVDNLSGRAGVQWQPNPSQNYYFSYNRGYKGPAVDVSRAARAPDPATGYTPIVASETAYSFELGAKRQLFANRLQLTLNLFDQRIDNLQQNVLIPGTTNTFLINAGALETRGVEFDFRGRVGAGLELDGAVIYTDANYTGRFSDGRPVLVGCYPNQTAAQGCVAGQTSIAGIQARGSYRWRYNVGASYGDDLPGLPFGVAARVAWNWYDEVPHLLGVDPLMREESRGMLDASVTLTDDRERWSLQVFGRNLTDDFYFAYRSNSNNFLGRGVGWLPRDFRRHGGVKLTARF